MGTKEAPNCPRHNHVVPMRLRTLHSEQTVPDQVLAAYVCPECGHERRVPVEPRSDGGGELESKGAA